MDEKNTDRKEELKKLLYGQLEDPTVCMPRGNFELTEDEIWNAYGYVIREGIARNLPDALITLGKDDLKDQTICLLADFLKLKIDMKVAELIAAPGLIEMINNLTASHEDFGDTL